MSIDWVFLANFPILTENKWSKSRWSICPAWSLSSTIVAPHIFKNRRNSKLKTWIHFFDYRIFCWVFCLPRIWNFLYRTKLFHWKKIVLKKCTILTNTRFSLFRFLSNQNHPKNCCRLQMHYKMVSNITNTL